MSTLNILSWNICGLRDKLFNVDLKSYLCTFEIVCLQETWCTEQYDISQFLPGFTSFICPAKPAVGAGRNMGGTVVYMKSCYEKLITRMCPNFAYGIIMKFDKSLLNNCKDVLFINMYNPTSQSSVYEKDNLFNCKLQELENTLCNYIDHFESYDMILSGDLNARTGSKDDFVQLPNRIQLFEDLDELFMNDVSTKRCSKDQVVNSFGKILLNLCITYSMCILNGRIGDDKDVGEFTYHGHAGSSLIDYFICSTGLFALCHNIKVDVSAESDHMPVILTLESVCIDSDQNVQNTNQTKTRITESNCEDYKNELQNSILNGDFDNIDCLLDSTICDMNLVVEEFQNCLLNVSEKFSVQKKTCKKQKSAFHWFDENCRVMKRQANRLLRLFRQTRASTDLEKYFEAKKRYKDLCRQKKRESENNFVKSLKNVFCNPKLFWSKVRHLTNKPVSAPNISDEDWYKHFKNLFEPDIEEFEDDDSTQNVEHDGYITDSLQGEILNSEISAEEVISAVKQMQINKSTFGPIIPAQIVYGLYYLLPYFLRVFNKLFVTGQFPEAWTKSVLIPIHKKGNPNNTDNYRGIVLINIVSKVYISILNKRLTFYTDVFNSISESQAGFRKGYCTTDNAFVLYSVVNKYLRKKGGKLYVAFVDFRKAFDYVNRSKMFSVLHHNGISGHLLNSISALYKSVQLCIRSPNSGNCTDFFNSKLGLRQGCNLSPLLFSIFIDELTVDIENSGSHGVQLNPSFIHVLLLMFADDVALIADTVVGLQKQLNTLHNFCIKNKLQVNTEKTKVLVFKRGGRLARREKWLYNNAKLESVSGFTYVGMYFSSTLSLYKMAEENAIKAKKALIVLLISILPLASLNSDSFFKIFDTKISPIMLYGSELWGMFDIHAIENIQTYACKRFLHTSLRSCNAAILGDLGRFPIKILAMKRCISYWLRILKLPEDRYVKLCYNMLMLYDENGYENWATYIRTNLYSNGFGYVWESQSVQNEKMFLSEYVTRLKDQYLQVWSDLCVNNNKLNKFYVFIKPTFGFEMYVNCLEFTKFKRCMANFRSSSHSLMIEKGRHIGLPRDERFCLYCKNIVEDEYHFVFICPLYTELRNTYLPKKYFSVPTLNRFHNLMASTNVNIMRNLAMYLFFANKTREAYITL